MPDGYTGADVYDRMHRFPGNDATLDGARQAADALKSGHTELADRIRAIQTKLDGTWSGDTSAKAQAGLNPLIQTSTQAAADLEKSAGSMSGQHSAFSGTRDKLVKIDGPRPDTDDLASYMPWGASDSEKKAAQWDTNDKNNKEAYGTYYATTDTNRNAAAKDYPVLNAAPAGIAVAPPGGPDSVPGFTGDTRTVGRGGKSNSTGGRSTDYHAGGQDSSTQQPGGQQPGSTVGTAGDTGHSVPPPASHQTPSNETPPAPGQHPGGGPSDTTNTTGYVPPKPPVSSAPGFGSGLLPTFGPVGSGADGVGGGSGGFGSVGGFGTPGGAGSVSGGGTGGVGRGVAGTSGGAPGAGNGSGSGVVGERAGVARPGGASGGAGGAKGAGGMGGMGQGAGKGKGGEDEEHQRKIVLEEDPDELFGGIPDGMKATPPVIGD
ncbi:WXG100 family type VII secretion target [Amycolatopsis sp. H20-H5]|uniref:WXG100 family type VII secretion target n=1 Tax=Amycolatopsis sp. H20-H5 TaxID=3046309 RepID=UPI002DBA6B2D|nr:hypothetical protein [Amycolatopsis sp. H20-H5]MEC3978800.1 hypothetical protein [Amycolatopsis sp. H20-H5]